ncbi:MAG: hypothetical protein NDI94_03230 [Candidatus Woesearchaeota archaeon]|nr:hypothetical protein [Candidatus Woesearchaeota archaeon]
MKRHFLLSLAIILELISLIGFYLGYNSLRIVFAFNTLFWLVLMLEPYWKIGAWLLFTGNAYVYIYSLNIMIFRKFVFVSTVIAGMSLAAGLILVMIAWSMKQKEMKPLRKIDETVEETSYTSVEEKSPAEEEKKEKKPIQVYIATEKTLHKDDCNLVKGKGKIIGSLRYAESKGLKSCKVCSPF